VHISFANKKVAIDLCAKGIACVYLGDAPWAQNDVAIEIWGLK